MMTLKKLEVLVGYFHILGHPTKLRIVEYLIRPEQRGSAVVPTLLAHDLHLKVAVAAYSLKRLSEALVLDRECHGKHVFYTINPEFITNITEFFNDETS